MGIFDKLHFGRKDTASELMDQRLGLPDTGGNTGMDWQSPPDMPEMPPPPGQMQSPMQQTPQTQGRDMEIVEAKLDAIKAQLDSINQRLMNIERLANE